MRVDPLVARETLASIRRSHIRSPGRPQSSPLEKTAYVLGVSADTVERALPAGREAEAAIKAAGQALPPEATPTLMLVSYGEKPTVDAVVFSASDATEKAPPE